MKKWTYLKCECAHVSFNSFICSQNHFIKKYAHLWHECLLHSKSTTSPLPNDPCMRQNEEVSEIKHLFTDMNSNNTNVIWCLNVLFASHSHKVHFQNAHQCQIQIHINAESTFATHLHFPVTLMSNKELKNNREKLVYSGLFI